ncbi:MAG: hypothetical protein WA152_02735 [Microgenomates group bacterium]
MDRFFSIFGKVMLVLLVLSAMAYGGYYFGKQVKQIEKPEAVKTEDQQVVEETQAPIVVAQSPLPLTTVVAGVSKSAGLSFDSYSIMFPSDWTSKKESQTAMDEKLILTKEGYTITIFQAATGGALCLYPNDADFEGPSSKFEVYTTLTTKDNRMLRRSGDKNGTAFTACQKSVDGSFQQPTNYGHISVKLPSAWDQAGIDEVDSILSSLKKI